jgi:hypothetical protein
MKSALLGWKSRRRLWKARIVAESHDAPAGSVQVDLGDGARDDVHNQFLECRSAPLGMIKSSSGGCLGGNNQAGASGVSCKNARSTEKENSQIINSCEQETLYGAPPRNMASS